MMTYTETGLSLIADAVASGKQVKITRIELIADPERSEGELTHNAEIASVEKYNNTTIDIKAVTDNYNFKKDYFFNRVNVYATGADGQEVLFCFQHTKTCPIYIPAYDGRTIQNEIKIRLNVTSADVVDIVNDGVYVLRTDFEKELAKKINIADIVQDADKGEADKVISAAVAKTLQDQIDQKIDIKNIVQNAVTAATDKVVSAAVAKALQDQITELNTNTLVTGVFSECWFPGFAIDGMGFSIIIPKHYKSHTLTVSSAKIFVPASKTWVSTTVSSITDLVNCWRVILTTDVSMKLTSGSAYIANLGGQIK